MDKLIICETDRGRYAVRPMSWAGIWNEKGQIQESLNHLALFIEKEDAEKFVEWKEAEEQNRLPKLPCAVGDTAWIVFKGEIFKCMVSKFDIVRNGIFPMLRINETLETINVSMKTLEKTWFLTKEASEAALKELERGKGE